MTEKKSRVVAGEKGGTLELEMKYAGGLIDTLGLKQYGGPVPAIAELISNAWDADARNVWVEIPLESSWSKNTKIVVKDDGCGMSFDDCQHRYLAVGMRRRVTDKTDRSPTRNRPLLGRKGIGKLAGFGIADQIEIRTVKGGELTHFLLDYQEIKAVEFIKPYKPRLFAAKKRVDEPNGTTITLQKIKVKRRPSKTPFITSMANRFSLLPDDFTVFINDARLPEIELDLEYRFPEEGLNEEEIPGFGRIKWWMGFTRKTLKQHVLHGITVYSRNKLVQEPFFFKLAGGMTGQFSLHYLTGKVYADQLDGDFDLISSNRKEVLWDQHNAPLLLKWGQRKIRMLAREWVKLRQKRKEAEKARVKKKLDELNPIVREKVEEEITKVLIDEEIEPKKAKELTYGFLKVGENVLKELFEEIKNLREEDHLKLLELMKKQRLLEDLALAEIARIRVKVVQKFVELVKKKAREVPDLHNYLAENPWLIDPRYFMIYHEKRLDKLIQEKYEVETGEILKRADFFGLVKGAMATIVEIKRPGITVNEEDVNQLKTYVSILKKHLPPKIVDIRSSEDINGLLIGSEYDEWAGLVIRDSRSIGFQTWDSLVWTAENVYGVFLSFLEESRKKKSKESEE